MNIIQYNLLKIDRSKYPSSNNIFELIGSGYEHLQNKEYDNAIEDSTKGISLSENLRIEAVNKKDEYTANLSFMFKVYFDLIIAIDNFWKICDNADYQHAWSFLQDALGCTKILIKFITDESQLSIDSIHKYLCQVERLYPYSCFASIAATVTKITCSICKRSPYDPECNHIAGELYWGKMAVHIVEEIGKGSHVALTKNPKDKRCIIFMNIDKDKLESSPFKLIHFFIQNSKFPLRNFELFETKRRLPREFYDGWPEDSPCPCGSGEKFGECCFDRAYIFNPHYKVIFKEAIPLNF